MKRKTNENLEAVYIRDFKSLLKLEPISVGAITNRPLFKDMTQEKGITLVALIITIIVLIILAAVTIFEFTESGLLQTASKGAENYANAQEYEKQIMNNIDEKAKDVVKNITDIAGENGGTGTNPGGEENPPAPEEPELPEGWDSTKVYLAKSEDNIDVPVPIGFTVSEVAGEKSVSTGLVIKITQEGVTSEFVWVPVANASQMFEEVSEGVYRGKLYDSGTTPITYSSTGYREPDVVTNYDYDSSYYTNAGIKDKDGNSIKNSSQFKTQLQEEFNAMKTSVEKYNGFYIGRYETGDLSKTKASVSKNNSDINNQNWYTMYQKSKGIVEGRSSMIWGCQWDAVMKWFLSSTDENIRTYVTNSTGKGNYKGTNGNKAIPTGSNDDYSVNNIYDMAGNVYDWTLEAYEPSYRVRRRWLLQRYCV